MSRPESRSRETANLPRRHFLQAITAVPIAASVPSPGQAFSSLIASDPRFAEVDRLIREINETCFAQSETSKREGELDDNGDDIHEVATRKWLRALEALGEYADDVAENPAPSPADALVLAKIADFQIINEGKDICIDDQERCVPKAIRAVLLAHGIPLTEATAMTVQQDELDALIASRPPEPKGLPCGASAGVIIGRIRALGRAYDAAIRREGSISDGTPESNAAIAVTDRRLAELEALRDEVLTGLRSPFDARNPDRQYHLAPVEEYGVLCELVDALRPGFWTGSEHGSIGPVLRELHEAGTCRSDYYLEQAKGVNVSEGGASV